METMDLTHRDLKIISLIKCGADTNVIEAELGLNQWTLRDRIRKLRKRVDAATMLDLPGRFEALGVTLPPCDDEWVDADDPDAEADEDDVAVSVVVAEDDDDDGRITV
jgi:hypothetical protein